MNLKNIQNKPTVHALFWMTLWSIGILIAMSINKKLKDNTSVFMITLARYLFGTICLLPFLQKSDFRNIKHPILHITRVIISSSVIFLTYYCYRHLDITFAATIGLTEPIIISVLATIFLSEKISLKRWIAILIAFLGATIAMNSKYGGTFNKFVVFFIIANFFCALSSIILKKLTKDHRPIFLVFSVSAFSLVISIIISFYTFTMPSPMHVFLMLVMALSAVLSNLCIAKAFKIADASFVGSLEYMKIIISIPFGFIIFGELPTWNILLGGLLIFTAYMILIKTKSIKPHKC